MYCLEKEIVLHAPAETVWAFLSTPLNLNELTPPGLDFKILSDLPDVMYNGLIITYEIKIPGFGTHRWVTEIKHIKEGISFVDEQRIGPYKLWYHQHRIEAVNETTTRMCDTVFYRLPFGPLGRVVHHVWVEKMLEEIFTYRSTRLHQIFGGDGAVDSV